jgi:hypothetical protein
MDEEPLLFSTAGRNFAHATPVQTHNARSNTITGQIRDTFAGNSAYRRGGDVPLSGPKQAGAKPDTNEELVSAGVFGEPVTRPVWLALVVGAALIAFLAAAYTGMIFHQEHRINALIKQSSLQNMALADPVTGFTCAHCDTATGDLVFEGGTVFLGAAGADLMRPEYADACMTCDETGASTYGADLHRGVPLLQDDHVPQGTNGETVYAYGYTFQTTSGVPEDGSLPRAPYHLEVSDLMLRSGILGLSRYATGQACNGTTCSVTYDTAIPTSSTTAGFPDVCSGTTDATIPANSIYTLHRDMAGSVLFADMAMTPLWTILGNSPTFDATFVHLCVCIVRPSSTRTQYCTSPLIGGRGGGYIGPNDYAGSTHVVNDF